MGCFGIYPVGIRGTVFELATDVIQSAIGATDMDRAEAAAKSILEKLITGARLRYRESQSLGEHDFDLEYPSGTKVPLEVTISTDEAAEATRAAIRNRRRQGSFVPRVHSAYDWYVHPRRYANINKIRARVDGCLAAIEVEGRKKFNAFTDSTESPAVFKILQELGIEYGDTIGWKSPGIRIAMPADGGLIDSAVVNEAVETEARKIDIQRKLSSAPGVEKHLFVYVATTRHIVWAAVRDENPPTAGPALPPEITDAWVTAWAGDGAWHTVWHARRGFSWAHKGRVNIDTGDIVQ